MRLTPTQDHVENPSTAADLETTGFFDNWNAALGGAMSEDLPVVSRLLPTEAESSRKKRLNDYLKNGDIPYSVAMFYGKDLNGLAGYARDRLGLGGLFTDEEYHEQLKQEYKGRRDYSQSVFEKATWLGKIGQLAGTAHAYAIDPVYAVSALTGYGTAATIGKAMLMTAGVEAGIEAVAQPFKMDFREEIGSEYGAVDALAEIAYAGIGAGILAGAAKGISKWAGKTFSPDDISVRDAIEVFESISAPELDPVINTLRHADPDANLKKVLQENEAIDIRRADESPARMPKRAKSDVILGAEEEAFLKRQPEEGVPRGTPTEGPKPVKVVRMREHSPQEMALRKMERQLARAESAAKKAEAHPRLTEDSVAGRKARAAAIRERSLAEQLKTRLEKERVPRGTPSLTTEPDLRHPLVVEADAEVHNINSVLEDCF